MATLLERRVVMQLNLGHVIVDNMQKAQPKWHCSEFVKTRGWDLAFSYLLDDNSVNETKRNTTIVNKKIKVHGMGSITEGESSRSCPLSFENILHIERLL